MTALFTANRMRLMQALTPVLHGTAWWDRRYDVEYYVNLCEMAGFCNTDDMRRACAQRYMAGKRKVTQPGTLRKKRAQRERKRLLQDIPIELTESIDFAYQFYAGKDKAINAMVGMVLKQYKADPLLVRELLLARLRI